MTEKSPVVNSGVTEKSPVVNFVVNTVSINNPLFSSFSAWDGEAQARGKELHGGLSSFCSARHGALLPWKLALPALPRP